MSALPKLHNRAYTELMEKLGFLGDCLHHSPEDIPSLLTAGRAAQSHFQTRILPLPTAELSPTREAQLRSVQTEIHRVLRLILTDILFLGAAKTPTVQSQKLQALNDRLTSILSYCQQLLQDSDRRSIDLE